MNDVDSIVIDEDDADSNVVVGVSEVNVVVDSVTGPEIGSVDVSVTGVVTVDESGIEALVVVVVVVVDGTVTGVVSVVGSVDVV